MRSLGLGVLVGSALSLASVMIASSLGVTPHALCVPSVHAALVSMFWARAPVLLQDVCFMRTRVDSYTQKKSSWKRQASCALLRQDRYVARQDRNVRLVMLDVSHHHAISAPIVV